MKTKTQFTNRILSLVLSIMMVVSMLPMNVLTASAAEGTETSVTGTATIDLSQYSEGATVDITEDCKIVGDGNEYNISLNIAEDATVIFDVGVSGVKLGGQITVADGKTLTLLVPGNAEHTVNGGISLGNGSNVIIEGDLTKANNKLTVTATGSNAGIGANNGVTAGDITIRNARVDATGSGSSSAPKIAGAGIGTAKASMGNILIVNSIVTAAGGYYSEYEAHGAAIGMGSDGGTMGNITLIDSEITASHSGEGHASIIGAGPDFAEGDRDGSDIGTMGDIIITNTDLHLSMADSTIDEYAAMIGTADFSGGGLSYSVNMGKIIFTDITQAELDEMIATWYIPSDFAEYGGYVLGLGYWTHVYKYNEYEKHCVGTFGGVWVSDGNGGIVQIGNDDGYYVDCKDGSFVHDFDEICGGTCSDCGVTYQVVHTMGTAATCSAKAVCSVCGDSYGEVDANAHNYGDWVSNGNGTHTRTCANDSTHTENGDCSGGTATCKEQAVCDICKTAYGALGGHSPDAAGYTVNADGTHSYTCSSCGNPFTESHTFTDGACAGCGKVKTFTVTVNLANHGTVEADKESATAGTTVTLTVDPADDYRLATLTINNGAVEYTKVNETTYTFVMPDAEVTVDATFEPIPATVTCVGITVDGTEYSTGPVAVRIPPSAQHVTVNLYGTYLNKLDELDSYDHVALGSLYYSVSDDRWVVSDDGTKATLAISIADLNDGDNGHLRFHTSSSDNIDSEIQVIKLDDAGTDLEFIYFNAGDLSTYVQAEFEDCYGNLMANYSDMTPVEGEDAVYYIAVPKYADKVTFKFGSSNASKLEIPMAAEGVDMYTPGTDGAESTWSCYHKGGTATCMGYKCEKCDQWYGEKDTDNHTGTLGNPVPTEDGTKHVAAWSCCGITVEEAHTLNYSVNESEDTITVSCSAECGYTGTATISAKAKNYDGTAVTIIVTKTGSLENTDIPVTLRKDGEDFTGEPKDVGTYAASITLGDHQPACVYFMIYRRDVTVTADAVSKEYGETDPQLTYKADGLVDGETLTGVLTRVEGENAYTYPITQGTLTNEHNPNYNITFVDGVFTINPTDNYTEKVTQNQDVIRERGEFVKPTYTDINNVYVVGMLDFTYEGNNYDYPELVEKLKTLAADTTVSVSYTFTPTDSNYAQKTGTLYLTICTVKFTVNGEPATAENAIVRNGILTYGEKLEDRITISSGLTANLTGATDTAPHNFSLSTSGSLPVGTHTIQLLYNGTFCGITYENVVVCEFTVTITDKTPPAGNILIKENGWSKFWNTITFGIFCKDYVDVTITADGTGSGIAKVEYLLSETALEENNLPTDGWTTLSSNNGKYSFSIQPQNKVAVYVRIIDEGGNVTVINSDGIVVYEDSEAVDTEITYTYKENSNKNIVVDFNGNTVKSIACGEKVLAANTDYSVDYESGKIVLKATYLDTLSAGNYTFTVSYNPMGVKDSGVTDLTTTFTVKVEPTSIAGATVTVNGTFTYDGNAKTPDPVVVLGGVTLVKDTDYTVSYAKNVNAGTATVTVTGTGNYSGTASGSFEIKRAELTNVSVQQNGKLTYNGKAQTPAVTANAAALNGAKVYFMYSADGTTYGSMPTFTSAGTYTVYYCAYTVDNNFFDIYNTFTVTIDKATVNEPTIASKPYNNSAQTADISDSDLYTVEENNGGTEKGSYDVVLKLKDSANYKWSTTDNDEVTLQFVISAAQNGWDTKPSIEGWTYGETAKAPVADAKYGAVKVVYSGTANDGTAYNSEAVPTKAGSYTATFTVEGTEDYSGLSEQVNFTIAKKAVTVTANDASKTYGDSDPALTYTHTELVGSDALIITVARASGENANTYTITASQAEGANPNYGITFKNGTFTIGKAALTVTVEDKTATYGDAVPNYTVKYDGFKNGDDKGDLGGTIAFDCDYAQFSDKGEYTVKASGYTSGNYTITYVDGKLTVNAKPITVTIQNATSVYGDTLAELKATDNGIVNGDANVYSLATTATGTSNVGKYAITGTALDSNYDVTFVNGEYEITKREITITVDAKNAIVNTVLPTYTYKVEGLVGEDKLVTEPTLTCNVNIAVIGEYDITATGADAGDNYSIKYVPAKLTVLTDNAVDAAAGYTEELKDYDPATVTSEDKAELDEILGEINTLLDDENITDNGKKALEEVKEEVEKLIKEITDAADATDTENVGKVENVTPENVTPENKTDLEGAKADLEKALEDHGSNMTEDEKKAVEDAIKRIDEALEVIGNVEAVEDKIGKLPENITKNDEAAIKAADDAYNALSDYEKSLVDKDAKKALDDAKAALAELNKPADPNSPQTGDNSNMFLWIALLFISGGAVITLTVVDRKRRTAANK